MYIADYLNSRGLFQRTGGWMTAADMKARGHAFSVLLQRASQSLFHLDQCDQLRMQALGQFSTHLGRESVLPTSLHAWSPLVSGLIVELSGLLAALRVMQNDAWSLISSASGSRDTPASIRDACATFVRQYGHGNKRPRWLGLIDGETRRLIVNYWEESGCALANYRDVDQHLDVLARGAMYFPERDGAFKLVIQLPDNPESKSRARFTYSTGIDALELARRGFFALHDLVESIAETRGAAPKAIQQSFEFSPPIVHQAGVSALTAIVLFDVNGKGGIIFGQNEKTQITARDIAL